MLRIPTNGNGVVKFIGIDPGSRFPGVAQINYDVPNRKIVRVAAQCLNLERLSRRSIHSAYQDPTLLRLLAFKAFLCDMFRRERPMKVASEYPYLNANTPGAVIPLAKCLQIEEEAVYEYNPYLSLEKIDPSSIKNAVGVKGNSGEKHAMTEAIKKIPEIMDVLMGDIDTMNNNAVDSIAVAYCSLMRELGHELSK